MCKSDVVLLDDPRFVDKAWLRENGLVSFAGYPLEFDGEILGVLAMFARRALTELELEWLGIFAAQASVAIKNAGLFAEVTTLTRRLEAENVYLKEELGEANATGIVGRSATLGRALVALERVAPTMSTVLIHGETGTGKELFARALHEKSARKDGPLVKVNCAAIAPSLVESELFGHEKGAFTGALHRRIGRFELAHGGTLFLDEIGELPVEAQAKLLRVLQEHELERVGGSQAIHVDARIVAATNRDLAADVKSGRFRADLFYRLNVFPIEIPPCATGARTSRSSSMRSCWPWRRAWAQRRRRSMTTRSRICRPTTGQATCASSTTSSSGHRSSRARTGLASPSCPS